MRLTIIQQPLSPGGMVFAFSESGTFEMIPFKGLRFVTMSAVTVWCLASMQAAPAKKPFTEKDRLDAIRRAQVWTATDIPSMDVNVGPKASDGFAAGDSVTCDYALHTKGSGTTPKFRCKTADGDELKGRYGARNGEVYAQVAASG